MRKWLIGGGVAVVVLLILLSHDSEFERSSARGRFTFVEKIHVERRAFLHIADSGGDAFIPIPTSDERILWQKLLVDGKAVWLSGGSARFWVDPSPDGTAVLLRSHSYEQPWRILLMSGEEIVVEAPKSLWFREGHDYPFDFWHWNEDGRTIEAFTHGWRTGPSEEASSMTSYRRIWRIDATDGSSRVITACEQRYAEYPDWTGTACETGSLTHRG